MKSNLRVVYFALQAKFIKLSRNLLFELFVDYNILLNYIISDKRFLTNLLNFQNSKAQRKHYTSLYIINTYKHK